MKKLLSYVLVFLVGFVLGWWFSFFNSWSALKGLDLSKINVNLSWLTVEDLQKAIKLSGGEVVLDKEVLQDVLEENKQKITDAVKKEVKYYLKQQLDNFLNE